MIIKKILSGSAEFFPNNAKDHDYIVIQEQDEIFKFNRIKRPDGDMECNFCYKPISKAEYFAWHENGNKWDLNFAPLITKEFLDYMKIDIFKADRDAVFKIMHKTFRLCFRIPNNTAYSKYLYRMYIYVCFMQNKKFTLTAKQKNTALLFKKQQYEDKVAVESMYKFFGFEQSFEIANKQIEWSGALKRKTDQERIEVLEQKIEELHLLIKKLNPDIINL